MSRRRKRQCFPILDAGSCPRRASLYTVDFGTRRNCATSITVKISLSECAFPFTFALVSAAIALFMTDVVSAGGSANLSGRELSTRATQPLKKRQPDRPLVLGAKVSITTSRKKEIESK